jgi:hypothetical protein
MQFRLIVRICNEGKEVLHSYEIRWLVIETVDFRQS